MQMATKNNKKAYIDSPTSHYIISNEAEVTGIMIMRFLTIAKIQLQFLCVIDSWS